MNKDQKRCVNCGNWVKFLVGEPDYGRCLVNGRTIVREGKTNAERAFYDPAEKTTCASWTNEQLDLFAGHSKR
jgi:hypothetical protein